MINIDIRTKFIRDDVRVFVIRPGAHYRLFQQFLDSEMVGIELPALDLPKFRTLDEIENLNARILRSVAIRRWFISGRPDGGFPGPLADFDHLELGHASSQFARYVRGMFEDMKKGDIVIVPPRSFKEMAVIGELIDEPNIVESLLSPTYPDLPLNGRRVKWLARIPKSDLPPKTLDQLQKPSVMFLLERTAWPKILRQCYGSYSTDQEFSSRFEITEERFQAADDFLIQAFFNFITANTDRVERDFDELLSLTEAAFEDLRLISPDLYTNVNSPGGISLKSIRITPIVIAVMLALAAHVGAGAVDAAINNQIVFGNSLAPMDDRCTVMVHDQVVTQLRLLGLDKWAPACEKIRSAVANTGIQSNVIIRQ
ncbi:hypothetical protein [Brucella pituitosa]|uniref:Uncharacterized protein n=1 Tax=Brucella pituitosa TaxID=571256 RepID=A0A643EYU3_9HYPH|nr:hypothetical protein [Brucella pituitosa]KAB0571077.1 hypothetical protein F7Q93_14025 [Brucella pituitosa]